jgi:hypothetical protein
VDSPYPLFPIRQLRFHIHGIIQEFISHVKEGSTVQAVQICCNMLQYGEQKNLIWLWKDEKHPLGVL